MSSAPPRGLPGPRVSQLLRRCRPRRSAGARIELLSGLLLGCPYLEEPLRGSAGTPEVFTAALDGFDCVTYVETVLALSRASSAAGFFDELRRIRYDGGRVEWRRRNHYMTGWIRGNVRGGVVRRVPPGGSVIAKDRLLDAVPGLAPRRARFVCVPKARVARMRSRLRTGDLLFFASTRAHLDVFHCGILVDAGGERLLRHATKSRGSVVEERLDDFLGRNRMSGVIAVRPRDAGRRHR
jgi:hypothetical protein